MNLLIPYVQSEHPDPNFNEFTYGDVNVRAKKLKQLKRGDYIFFHTTINRNKYFTAFFVVYEVMETRQAYKNKLISLNYENVHIKNMFEGEEKYNDDVLVFGDHIRSKVLKKPLLFNSNLAITLFPNMKFHESKSDSQNIGSSTRAWREIDDIKRELLIELILKNENSIQEFKLLSSEEVSNILEKDIEDFVAFSPENIGGGLKLWKRQYPLGDKRADLILIDKEKQSLTIVEIKQGYIGRDAISQIQGYEKRLKGVFPNKNIECVLICAGVMPAFAEDLSKLTDIRILIYGWNINLIAWNFEKRIFVNKY